MSLRARPASTHVGPSDEPRWHAAIAVVVVLALYITLPRQFILGPVLLAPIMILGLLLPLLIFAPSRHQETPPQRVASVALIALINFFNVASVALLIYSTMFSPERKQLLDAAGAGQHLLIAGAQIWLSNVLVYAMWYWEIDGGGPEPRAHASSALEFLHADFLFPQMLVGDERIACIEKRWKPLFVDYIFLAFTNALAFSPADTFPITRPAKMLMMFEAITSFVTIAVVLARAVGVVV
ncbi:MAG: hypothetical protein M3R30_06570 [Candidatus Eremiobacteraeota bacterium]|nr:hypothetical protein [Candidatus Eremiobacteraeota bacterium]